MNKTINARGTGVLLLVGMLALLIHVKPAFGQGTMGVLPDPINAREWDGYADRLGLSAEQRRAVNRYYEQYHEQFRSLRDGEIADFLNAIQQMQRSGMSIPDRREMERFGRQWETVLDRIRALDEQFFSMLPVVLTDDQLPMVDRVRMARERHRYASGIGMEFGWRAHDLSETLLRLNLTPEEREHIDPQLADYERHLTTAMRRQNEASFKMIFDMFDAMEEIGFTEEAMADPEEAARLMEAMQDLMRDMFARVEHHQHDLARLNLRTYQSLVNLLDEQRRRPFRDAFTLGTFSELAFLAHSEGSLRFESLLRIDELDDDLRQAIAEAQQAFESERDSLYERALHFASENPHSEMAMMFDGEEDSERQAQLAQLMEETGRLEVRGRQTMRDLLPREHEEKFNEHFVEAQMRAQDGLIRGESAEVVTPEPAVPSRDQFIPGPITTHDTAIYADLLSLDDNSRVLVEDLHERYMERFDKETEQVLAQFTEAQRQQWQFDPDTGQSRAADPSQITKVYDLRRKAMSTITAVDESFFDDMGLVLTDVSLERARLARMRGRYTATSRVARGIERGGAYADLSDIVRLLRWNPEQRRVIEHSLIEWERAVAAAMAEYFDALLASDEAQEVFFAQYRAQLDGNDMSQWHDFSERRREAIGPLQRRVRAARQSLVLVTESARDDIFASLSGDEAAAFLDAYKRRAFSSVYNDRGAVHRTLRRALNLPDLSPSAREALMELHLSYNSRYYDLTERMVDLRRRSPGDIHEMVEDGEMMEHLAEESAYERLQFDRDELNAWANREIRGLLNEQQRERIGEDP